MKKYIFELNMPSSLFWKGRKTCILSNKSVTNSRNGKGLVIKKGSSWALRVATSVLFLLASRLALLPPSPLPRPSFPFDAKRSREIKSNLQLHPLSELPLLPPPPPPRLLPPIHSSRFPSPSPGRGPATGHPARLPGSASVASAALSNPSSPMRPKP